MDHGDEDDGDGEDGDGLVVAVRICLDFAVDLGVHNWASATHIAIAISISVSISIPIRHPHPHPASSSPSPSLFILPYHGACRHSSIHCVSALYNG